MKDFMKLWAERIGVIILGLLASYLLFKITLATNMLGTIIIGVGLVLWLKLDEINTTLKGQGK